MILYKYLSIDYWEKILGDNLIRFTQPSVLNDPFEMQAYYESLALDPEVKQQLTEENAGENIIRLFEEALPKIPEEMRPTVDMDFLKAFSTIIAPLTAEIGPLVLDKITSGIGTGFYQGLDQSAGVLSLTEKKESLLMWAHYAQQHRGMVVGFDVDHPFFRQKLNSTDDFRHLRKVEYEQERPTVRFTEDENFSSIFLTKSLEWCYENEWRMILPVQTADVVTENGGEAVYLFRFPREAVVEIILGTRISHDARRGIIEFIQRNQTYEHTLLQEAKLDLREFRLNFFRIPTTGGFGRPSPNVNS